MLICWNDIKIHLGFEDSYFVPPPTKRAEVYLLLKPENSDDHVCLLRR